jgi:hypothetical protein
MWVSIRSYNVSKVRMIKYNIDWVITNNKLIDRDIMGGYYIS